MTGTAHSTERTLDRARVLRSEERDRLRVHLEARLSRARERGLWRDHRDSVLCLVLLAIGLRVSEACKLHRADVLISRGDREIVVRRGKGGRRRTVRLPDAMRDVIRQYLDAFPDSDGEAPLFPGLPRSKDPMCRTTAWRRWKAALRAVGLDARGRGCHAARHGLGLALYKEKQDLRLVAAVLGHTDLRSTMVYTAPLPEDVDAALDATWMAAKGKGSGRKGR